MGLEQIGLQAILQDENFQAGLKRYQQGVGQMERSTDSAASVLTRLGSVASGALVVGIGAATAAFGAMVGVAQHGLSELQQWGEGIDKLGDQFGLTGEKASGFAFLASKVGAPVDELGFALNSLTRGLADMKNAAGGATMVTAKSADAIQNLKEKAADAQEKLNRATKALSEAKKPTDAMRYAVDDARKALARINGDLADATKLVPKAGDKLSDFAQGLKELGISAYNSKGKLKTFDEILPEIMDAFNKLPPGIKASDLAMKLFGTRGGGKMLDFLRKGSAGLADATKKAKAFGLELSSEESDAVETFGQTMSELTTGLKGPWIQIGLAVLPIAQKLADWFITKIPLIVDFAKRLGKTIGDVADVFHDLFVEFQEGKIDDAFSDFTAGLLKILGVSDEVSFAIGNFVGDLANVFRDLFVELREGKIEDALSDFTAGIGIAWSKISPELAKWGAQFWNWLTGKGGALEQAGTQLGKVITAIKNWATTNAPNWITTLSTLKDNFWDWLTGKNGAIAQVSAKAGEILKALGDELGKQIHELGNWAKSSQGQAELELTGKAIGTTIVDGLKAVMGLAETGNGVASSLGGGVGEAADVFITIGRTIGKGIVQGIIDSVQIDWFKLLTGGYGVGAYSSGRFQEDLKKFGDDAGLRGSTSLVNALSANLQSPQSTSKVGMSVDSMFRQAQNASANGVRASGDAAGSNFGTGSTQGIYNKSNAVAGAVRYILATGGTTNQAFANAVGFGLGQAFGGGLEAALNAEVARVMGIINRILSMIRSIQNFNPASGAGSLGTNTNTASGAASPLVTRSSVSQPVTNNTTSNSRTVNVTVPISGTFNGTSESGIEAIAQHVADRTVAAILNAV